MNWCGCRLLIHIEITILSCIHIIQSFKVFCNKGNPYSPARYSCMSEDIQNVKPKSSRKVPGKIKASSKATVVNHMEKRELIGKAAYYRAERRGFIPGFELDDWLAAELEIEGSLRKTPTGPRSKRA